MNLSMSGPAELLLLVGFLTGAVLYAMLLAMVTRQSPVDRLALTTALLGCLWNAGEIAAWALEGTSLESAVRWLHVLSYGALGLLGAVVVHSVARVAVDADIRGSTLVQRLAASIAYAGAIAGAVMHAYAASTNQALPSAAGLIVVTIALTSIAAPLVVVTRKQANGRRAWWLAALGVFAVSALHLGRSHGANEGWVSEIVGHHASIPLAFAILYQDYRFALADLFLKQALTLLALVTVVFAAWSMVAPSLAVAPQTSSTVGVVLLLWIGTALLFPLLRRGVTTFVDRLVLQRANYATLVEQFTATLQQCASEDVVLDRACQVLAPALNARAVAWEPRDLPEYSVSRPQEVPIQTTDSPQYVLIVGRLAGGRRLLSDDAAMLDRIALLIARRIDALRLTDERYERMLQEREMRNLATEAELRALRSQINPHFLFNALTTIGYLIEGAPPRALETLLRLTTLLRSVFRSEGEFTTLGHERELIECYLQIEHERFEERLLARIDIPPELNDIPIPSLIVQPLVENAIKHGVASALEGGNVHVVAHVTDTGIGSELCIAVRNTGAPMRARPSASGGGVGLRNVERRLACYYGDAARLELRTEADGATVAELHLPTSDMDDENAHTVSRAAPA